MNTKSLHSRRDIMRLGLTGTAALLMSPAALAATADGKLSLLVVGDWGDPEAGQEQKKVAGAMARAAARTPPRMVISVGDNFYPDGVKGTGDKLWNVAFEAVYDDPALQCPWYAVLGNHDRKGNAEAEIAFEKIDPRWHMPSRYYSHVEPLAAGGDAEFFYLDTTLVADDKDNRTSPTADQIQFDWLNGALKQSKARWRIVVGHHPVFSGGHHGNTPALVARLKPLLDRYKVQAFINGHDHDMQHIAIDGVHYLTAGSGSKTRPTGKIDGTLFAASTLGFLHAALSADAMEISFIDAGGAVVHSAAIPADPGDL